MIFPTSLSFLTGVVLVGEVTVAAAKGSPQLKSHFVHEMSSETAHMKVSSAKSQLGSSTLRKKIMEKATLLPRDGRQLQDNNQNGNQANANAQIQDGADDYFMAFGAWSNAFGFDPTQYALSYHRCAEVRQFDDELAAQEDSLSVFATKHFAVFRFCPLETCMGINEEEELSWWNRTYGQQQAEDEDQAEEDQAEYEYGQEPDIVGARGEGCQSNYGEYMIELSDYLEIMSDFREQRFEAYCEYCQDCLYKMYQQWMNSQGRSRELKEYKDQSWRDDIEGVDFSAHRDLGGCPGINSCWKYKNICGNGIETDFETYFECTEVERKNGMVVYVGPHCADDGFTIKLGVYGDEGCNEYIGKGVDIQNVLGEKLDDNYLQEYVSGSVDAINQLDGVYPEFGWCIPCKASDQLYPFEYGSDDYSGDEVSEICENLYLASARCDKHYRSWTNKAKQSKQLAAAMNLQCDFIDSVVMGNYDEMGFVILQQENITNPSASGLTGLIAKTMSFRTNPDTASRVTPLQVFGLCASIFACCILGVWAAALHKGKSVSVTGWRPKRGLSAARQSAIARQDSGIVMGRSDDSTYCAPK